MSKSEFNAYPYKNSVEYLVTDYDDGEEFFFDTYKEAELKLNEVTQ